MYFQHLPNIVYKTPEGETILTKDIFVRAGFRSGNVSNLNLDSYYVEEGETPEIIADKLYGSPTYHWIILLVNNIVNTFEEWPRTQEEMVSYLNRKYGSGNLTAVHHYSITGSDPEIIVDYDAASIIDGTHTAVTNLDYETKLNEEKKQIYTLKPQYVGQFAKVYRRLVRS